MPRVPCRVCNKPYDGTTHCSINACRACAMFLRRSETWNIMPKCRTGRNDCLLDRAGRISCSSCRYQKCLEAGVNPKKNQRSLKCSGVEGISNHCEPKDDKMTFDLHILVADNMPVLKRFSHFYAICANNKKAHEFTMLRADGVKLVELLGNRYMGRITNSLTDRLMQHDIMEFGTLMDGSFPAFNGMDKSYQDNLMYLLMFPLFELAASFRSLRVFNDVNCKKVLCTDVLYADLTDMTGYIDPRMFENPLDYHAVVDYVKVWWNEFLNRTLEIMHRINLTDVEFISVCALTIWDDANFGCNRQLRSMAEKHRSLIYKDLDYYYKNILHMDNYVDRIMNFKELLDNVIRNNPYSLCESFYFLRAFNFYNGSKCLWDASYKVVNAYESNRK